MPKKKPVINKTTKENQALIDLFREILNGMDAKNITPITFTEGQGEIDFTRFCHEIYNNPFFERLIGSLIYDQINFIANYAPDYDTVRFNRATLNGFQLIKEVFGRYASEYDVKYSRKERQFDENASFESVS